MDKEIELFDNIELRDCPICGGVCLLDEENGWCISATCMDCGCHTAVLPFNNEEERMKAAEKAAFLWNQGKVISLSPGE